MVAHPDGDTYMLGMLKESLHSNHSVAYDKEIREYFGYTLQSFPQLLLSWNKSLKKYMKN